MVKHSHPALQQRQHLQDVVHKTSVSRRTLPFLLHRHHAQHPQIQTTLRPILPSSILWKEVIVQHHQHSIGYLHFWYQNSRTVGLEFVFFESVDFYGFTGKRFKGKISGDVAEIDF